MRDILGFSCFSNFSCLSKLLSRLAAQYWAGLGAPYGVWGRGRFAMSRESVLASRV